MRLAVFAFTLALSVSVAAQSTISKNFEPLQGAWSLATVAGKEFPPGLATLIIKGDKYEELKGGDVYERGTIKLDPSTTPISIDLVIAEGEAAGKIQRGLVVETSSDTMTLILGEPGATTRPLATSADKLVFTRIKYAASLDRQ